MSKLRLSGRVVHISGSWGDGLPVHKATVRIIDIDRPGRRNDVIWEGKTDQNGNFSGISTEWRDTIDIRIPFRRAPLKIPDRSDVLQLQAHIIQGSHETRLPFKYLGGSRRSPNLVVPWGPLRNYMVMLRPIKGESSLPEMKKSELEEIVGAPGTKVLTSGSIEQSEKNKSRNRKKTFALFEQLYAKERPDIVSGFKRFGMSKNYVSPKIKFVDNKGKKRSISLLHPESFIDDMVLARRLMTDAEHQANTYKVLRSNAKRVAFSLPGELQREARKYIDKLPGPDALLDESVEVVDKAVLKLANVMIKILAYQDESIPDKYPGDCSEEEGAGFGGDMSAVASSTPSPDGLLANNWWPLKWYTTCIRDQGRRGTCVAFGIAAALECCVAVRHERWINVSEQDLYMHQKLYWFPIPWDWYGDGYNAAYSVLLQVMTGLYVFPYEYSWDYNQSNSRQSDDDDREYTDSCNNYAGEACSDTNHQAEVVCRQVNTTVVKEVVSEACTWVEDSVDEIPIIGGFISDVVGEYVCEPVTELVETVEQIEVCTYESNIPGTSGFRLNGAVVIWDPLSWFDSDVSVAKAFLATRVPVVFCFSVMNTFDNHDNGYVSFDSSETLEESRGGHCALFTGYVDNADLPANAPQGAGGGYFILKNSWGSNAGDVGYWYLPYDWVQKWGTLMVAITNIAP